MNSLKLPKPYYDHDGHERPAGDVGECPIVINATEKERNRERLA